MDDSGNHVEGGTISHARNGFQGEVGTGSGADGTAAARIGTVDAGLVEDRTGPVEFSPPDVTSELEGLSPTTLRGTVDLELGPGTGVHHPVSAELVLRPAGG